MRKLVRLLIATTVLITAPMVTQAQVSVKINGSDRVIYSRSRALLISVGKYKTSAFDRLPNVHKEMDRLAEELERQGFEVQRMRDPVSANLYPGIKTFLAESGGRSTRSLVYYSGHGWTDDRMTGYLVPSDAPNPSMDRGGFMSKALSMFDVRALVESADVNHLMFIFDSCFSGAIFHTRSPAIKPPNLLQYERLIKRSKQFFAAGDETQKVPAASDFTPAFTDGIAGAGDTNQDGIVSAGELYQWLYGTISALGKQTPRMGGVLNYEDTAGEFIFVPQGRRVEVVQQATPSVLPKPTALALQQVRAIGSSEAPKQDQATPEAPTHLLAPRSGNPFFEGINIRYYRKTADGNALVNALDAKRVPYVVTKAERPGNIKTNAIACHPDIPKKQLQELARVMIDNGFEVRVILPFNNPDKKPNHVEIISVASVNPDNTEQPYPAPALTRSQIETLPGCVEVDGLREKLPSDLRNLD